MRTYFKPFTLVPLAFVVALTMMMAGCAEENPLETAEVPSQDLEAPQQQVSDLSVVDADVAGRTISNLELPLKGGGEFTGRITNLQLEKGSTNGTVLASGRVVGQANGERINEAFENVELQVFDQAGDLVSTNQQVGTFQQVSLNQQQECQILFLEIGPIFIDLLGLVIELPNEIVVEIRAEEGAGNLLGNLLCGLVGILDPPGV